MPEVNRVWRLRKRPTGAITDDVLQLEEEALPEPGEGEFLFRLNYLSLDPTNRIWMSDVDQYMPPVDLGAPMRGKGFRTYLRTVLPDSHHTIEDLIAEGDKVVTRFRVTGTHRGEFLGVPATGKPINVTGMWIHRLENGHIVEGRQWGQWDALGFLQQVGAVPG